MVSRKFIERRKKNWDYQFACCFFFFCFYIKLIGLALVNSWMDWLDCDLAMIRCGFRFSFIVIYGSNGTFLEIIFGLVEMENTFLVNLLVIYGSNLIFDFCHSWTISMSLSLACIFTMHTLEILDVLLKFIAEFD